MNRVKYFISLLLRAFNNKRLRTVLSLILFFIALFGFIFFITEPDVKSYSDGLWWALVTITTVGYGDITPLTSIGRLVASTLMFLGLGLIASLTAVISVKFIQSFVDRHTNDDVLEKLEDMQKDIDEIKRKIQ